MDDGSELMPESLGNDFASGMKIVPQSFGELNQDTLRCLQDCPRSSIYVRFSAVPFGSLTQRSRRPGSRLLEGAVGH